MVDARGRLVMPGLIDTHRHVWQGAIGGFTPQMTGAGYGPVVLRGIAPRHTPDDIYAGTLWGALQALDAGITTIGDWAHTLPSGEHADADVRGLRGLGHPRLLPLRRARTGRARSPTHHTPRRPQDAGRAVRRRYQRPPADGHGTTWSLLHQPERNADDFAFARELGLPISVHVGMAGTSDAVMTLERFGLLGADVNYAHGNMLTDKEFDLIAPAGAPCRSPRPPTC